MTNHCCWRCRPTIRWRNAKRVTWEHLAQERLLVLHDMHCLGDQVMGLCRRHSLRPDYAFRGAQLATIQHMITLGMGVSLIPEMAARSDNTTSRVYRAIAGDSPYRTIAVAWHLYRYRTTAARRMLDELQRFARQYSSENGGAAAFEAATFGESLPVVRACDESHANNYAIAV
jgi:DNA-binding transcriptional LysR family regulator